MTRDKAKLMTIEAIMLNTHLTADEKMSLIESLFNIGSNDGYSW